jgi:CRISPR-associated protein Cmr6
MLFGGFGKSWRRAKHDLFHPDYYNEQNPFIGCHWQYGRRSLNRANLVTTVSQIANFFDKVRDSAGKWMTLTGITPHGILADWRESWHPNKVQVWARIAEDEEDSKAIKWFHGAYGANIANTIYRTDLTGRMSQIGRIWHRMYPKFQVLRNPNEPKKPIIRATDEYIEILVIFPDDSQIFADFQQFLKDSAAREVGNPFVKVWGNIQE